ncbi:acyl-CoA synthetase family member 2, mitochondrial [Copidosoma floridanum]|uniref:acyl-CoA synthetase family member 2, mitochondrial n=1 Tax=Copidosoma floridanum TaxID=29053 RepID=UPI000C6F849E|nr:acyl-CoA synthetase family member 2, mitochondrial [Copidosoma floridanum]
MTKPTLGQKDFSGRRRGSSSTRGRSEWKPAYLSNPGNRPLLEATVGQALEEAARRWPERDCLVSLQQGAQRLSFSGLLDRADRLAAGLRGLGLRRADRVGVWGPNHLEWLVSYMGAARAGLVVAGINPAYRPNELEYCLGRIGARAVLAAGSYREQNYADMLLRAKGTCPALEHVVVWGQRGHVSAVTRLDVEGRKICLNVPYFHAFGMIMGVVGPLHAGSTVVLENPTFNPVKSIEAIVGQKCSVTFGTPTMWTNMIDVQNRTNIKIDCLYTGLTGGSPATPDLYRRIRTCLGMDHIKSIYGLSETTAVVNQSLHDESPELTETTIGYISDDIEMKVIDDKGDIVPFGTPGELCVRGYCTMMGYWGDEESTKKMIQEDGWLKTGDQYILREDGYGHIVGRLKDMLIRGGENIFPKEIEDFLATHPAILETHAFGVHDDVYGEEICACVRLSADAKLTAQDIVEYAKGKIARFKIPRYIEFREEFPKTASGKIQKFKLKEELEDRGVVPRKPQN